MQNDEQAAWDEAKRQAASQEDHTTIPFVPAPGTIPDPYSDQTAAFPQGFQPATGPYGQGGYGQNAYEQQGSLPGDNSGYPNLPQTAYQGNVPPPLPPQLPANPAPKPEKPYARILFIAAMTVGILLILGLGGYLLLPVLAANHSPAAVASTPVPVSTPAATPAANPASKNTATYLTEYRTAIRTQIAQGLHLTPEQLGAQLAAGKTLSSIAQAQGLTSTQYQKLVTDSFQSAFQPAVTNNDLTQKQVDALVKRMLKQSKTLNNYLAIRPAKHTPKATPTVAAN